MNLICKMKGHNYRPTGNPCKTVCARCGDSVTEHSYHGCTCAKCGEKRFDHHNYKFVEKTPVYGKCSNLGASDIYGCNYCKEEDCSHVKTGEEYTFQCAVCGSRTSISEAAYRKYFLKESNRNKKEDFHAGNLYEIVW